MTNRNAIADRIYQIARDVAKFNCAERIKEHGADSWLVESWVAMAKTPFPKIGIYYSFVAQNTSRGIRINAQMGTTRIRADELRDWIRDDFGGETEATIYFESHLSSIEFVHRFRDPSAGFHASVSDPVETRRVFPNGLVGAQMRYPVRMVFNDPEQKDEPKFSVVSGVTRCSWTDADIDALVKYPKGAPRESIKVRVGMIAADFREALKLRERAIARHDAEKQKLSSLPIVEASPDWDGYLRVPSTGEDVMIFVRAIDRGTDGLLVAMLAAERKARMGRI